MQNVSLLKKENNTNSSISPIKNIKANSNNLCRESVTRRSLPISATSNTQKGLYSKSNYATYENLPINSYELYLQNKKSNPQDCNSKVSLDNRRSKQEEIKNIKQELKNTQIKNPNQQVYNINKSFLNNSKDSKERKQNSNDSLVILKHLNTIKTFENGIPEQPKNKKTVKFSKTEIHFSPESGKLAIIESDKIEKSPKKMYSRKNRRTGTKYKLTPSANPTNPQISDQKHKQISRSKQVNNTSTTTK